MMPTKRKYCYAYQQNYSNYRQEVPSQLGQPKVALNIGDKVKLLTENLSTTDKSFGNSKVENVWEVIDISTHFYVMKNRNGTKEAFTPWEIKNQMVGGIIRG